MSPNIVSSRNSPVPNSTPVVNNITINYNAPVPSIQQPPSYNGRPATTNVVQQVSNTFRPSNSADSYGSPQGNILTNDDVANVPVGSSLSFGSSIRNTNNGLDSGLTTSSGFSPLTTSTLDQTSLPKRNVFGTVSGQVKPGQTTTITLNNLRQSPEQLLLRETRQQQVSRVTILLQ